MTSPSILHSLGYDDMGNHNGLLHPNDKLIIEGEIDNGKYGRQGVPRAGGDATCICGYIFYHHPVVQGALYFHRTCEGIVKL